jgi:hypothetical protein
MTTGAPSEKIIDSLDNRRRQDRSQAPAEAPFYDMKATRTTQFPPQAQVQLDRRRPRIHPGAQR